MKRTLEIIFMFAVCLASFCAGWVMSLRHQKNLSQTTPSIAPLPENRFFPKPKQTATGNPMESAFDTFLAPPLTGKPSSAPPERAKSPFSPALPSKNLSPAPDSGEAKTPAENTTKNQPAPPPLAKKAEEKRPLSGSELKRKEKLDKLNRKAFERIKNRQNVFNARGRFSFLINVFSKEKEAVEYVQKLRGRFPLWGFFLKPDRQNFRVYLGPFLSKERAGDFIKTFPDPKPFPNYFLEMEGL